MSADLKPGTRAPAFSVQTTAGPRRLKDFAGGHLVLYFYPKDDTPGCTQEAIDLSAHADPFREPGAAPNSF